MAPGSRGEKRKRNDRSDSGDNGRPSPHRPGNAEIMRRDQTDDRNNNRRSSRGGRGGGTPGGRPRNDRRDSSNRNMNDANSVPVPPRQTQRPMSPPPRPSSSGQPQPATPTLAPSSKAPTPEPPKPPKPKRDPIPYEYTHLTANRMSSWATTGKQEIITAGKDAVHDQDEYELSVIFQEFLRAAIDGKVGASDIGNCIKEIIETTEAVEGQLDGPKIFLDCLSILMETEAFDPALQTLVSTAGISEALMRQILDAPLLQSLGLTRPTFIKSGIRQVTNLLYRQANHNLLREETEGYSKLLTELFTTSGTSGSEPPASDIADEAFERVKGLIGTFDLDVGRVLDVTLDVFAAVLIKQFRFFIKFLRVSSWWPRDTRSLYATVPGYNESGLPHWALPESTGWSTTEDEEALAAPFREERDRLFWERAREIGLDAFFELGGRRAADTETQKALLEGQKDDAAGQDATLQWINATGTIPPAGNRVAAQLLGFKLRFYSSPARDKEDILPSNLIYLAALLIKIGFISLRDLYPHLWPSDEDMEALKIAKMKELAEKERANRPGGANNALMMAGALADDTVPPPPRQRDTAGAKADPTAPNTATTEPVDELEEPKDQKVQLLQNLLTIGAIPESLFILGKFPWIPEAFPEVYDLIHRILHHSIQKVFEDGQIPPVEDHPLPAKKATEIDPSLAQKFRHVDPPSRKALRWPFADKCDVNEGMTYRFYWDEWADNVPICHDVDDIFTLCGTLLNISGVNIGRDVALLSKLASIGNRSLAKDHSESNLARWQDLLKRLLVPALSMTRANTNVVNEIYEMLRYYPAPVRYNIYAEWFEGQTSRLPAMQVAFARTRLETQSTMKRISLTNLAPMARALAKIAYASPGIVFKVALEQIESYPNLTMVVVECAKYFTDLGYDVLLWSLMSSLGGQNRSRIRSDDALLTSKWLLALSNFSGKIFTRYSIMNPTPILQYVNDQLYQGNSTDLIILEELIASMSGVVSDVDFTDAQLLAMTGGDLLRKQTLIHLQDKRFESGKTAKRLMRSLTDTKLAGQLLVAIAQHRQSAVYAVPEDEAHIKYLATIIDDTQRILFQYLDLLRWHLTVDEFDNLVPDTGELMESFRLEPSLAFLIGRASFSSRLSSADASNQATRTKIAITNGAHKVDSDGDAVMGSDDPSVVTVDVPDLAIEEGPASSNDISANGDDISIVKNSPPPEVIEPWRNELAPLVEAVQRVLPSDTWTLLDPGFYAVFWQLALPDVYLPMDSYTTENTRLTKEISEIMRDRADQSRTGVARRDEARKALELTRDNLLKESKQQMKKYEGNKARLNKEKSHWFTNGKGRYDAMSDALWEECFIPRLLLSPSDADYCFRMIKFLHSNGAPHFRTLGLYARFFRPHRLRTLVFTCTIREAENLGRFIKLVLGDLERWHSSKNVYDKEALGGNKDLPGFAKKLSESGKPEVIVEHEEFRKVLYSWHKNLNTALKTCLTGTEWMHIRNGITVLKGAVHAFPAVDFMGKAYQEILTKIGETEKNVRDDLSLTANALLPELKKRQSKWVMPQAFASNIGDLGSQQNGNKLTSAGSGTPQSDTKSVLKPTAPEFKPQSRNSSNNQRPSASEVEDGEVADGKSNATSSNARNNTSAVAQASSNTAETKPDLMSSNARSSFQDKEHTSRSNTPRPSDSRQLPARSSSRPDSNRNSSFQSLDKSNLPAKPDIQASARADSERHKSRMNGRDEFVPRNDRAGDLSRDRYRDSSRRATPDLMAPMAGRLNERQDPERDGYDSRRRENGRDSRGPRDSRNDRDHVETSRADVLQRREPEMKGNGLQADRGHMVNPERLANIDPARAALISGVTEPAKASSGPRDLHGSRSSSRAQSPRGDRPVDRDRVDDRQRSTANHVPVADRADFRRRDEAMPAPSGPRGDRMNDRGPAERTREASAFNSKPLSQVPHDPDHGRLSRPQSESSYGRLNQTADPPSGPRARDSRSGPANNRMAGGPVRGSDNRNTRPEPSQPATPEKGPPTGPSSNRTGRSGTTVAAPTSALPSPITGVHPSRAGKIVEPHTATSTSTSSNDPPIHPSRQGVIQQDQSTTVPHIAPIQTTIPSGPSIPSPHGNGPPSGPRGNRQQGNNHAASPTTSMPTGPAANDNGRSNSRRFASLQNIINSSPGMPQQGIPSPVNDRVMSIKGRGRNSVGGGEHVSGSIPPPPPGPPPSAAQSQAGPVQDVGRDLINPDRLNNLRDNIPREEQREREDRGGARGRDPSGRHEDRGGRGSRRSSRERSPRREGDRSERRRGPEEQGHERGGARDTRGGRTGRESDRDGHRRGTDRNRPRGEEATPHDGRDREIGRPVEPARDTTSQSWRGGRGGGDERDRRSGGGRDARTGEERRDGRARGEEVIPSKRRNDEGGSEREKRPRR